MAKFLKGMGNLKVLQQRFGSKNDPKLEDMPKSFSGKELIKWLDGKTKQFTVNKSKLKELNESGRLLPDVGINRYSRVKVLEYYLETKPRSSYNGKENQPCKN